MVRLSKKPQTAGPNLRAAEELAGRRALTAARGELARNRWGTHVRPASRDAPIGDLDGYLRGRTPGTAGTLVEGGFLERYTGHGTTKEVRHRFFEGTDGTRFSHVGGLKTDAGELGNSKPIEPKPVPATRGRHHAKQRRSSVLDEVR